MTVKAHVKYTFSSKYQLQLWTAKYVCMSFFCSKEKVKSSRLFQSELFEHILKPKCNTLPWGWSKKTLDFWHWLGFLIIRQWTLREKCPNTEFFLVCIFLYSVRIQENTDQKRLRIWTLFTQCDVYNSSSKKR